MAQSLECIAAGAVADIQQHQQHFLAHASNAAIVCDLYAQLFAGCGLSPAGRFAPRDPSRPLRLLYVVSSLVDGQAASANIARFCTLHDPGRIAPHVLCVEEFTRREPPLGFLQYPEAPSVQVGRGVIDRLPAGALTMLSARGDLLAGAREAIGAARELGADVAVFVGSPACPVQAGCAFARVAPRQINMNIGVPLPMPGIDTIIYNSPRRWLEDRSFLASRQIGSSSVETSGGDARAGLTTLPRSRESLNVPADALALVSAGNRLPARLLAGSFLVDLATFLGAHPRARWILIGPGDFAPVLERMGPLAQRVITLGPVADIRPVVKACDIFLNEYPEGGGNTVIEAMGCGVPVVALDAGPRHAQHIGAALSGDLSLTTSKAYWERVGALGGDPGARGEVGRAQQGRAVEKLDYTAIVKAYEAVYFP